MKYAFVRAQGKEFAIKRMCQIFQISRSGYYDWRVRQESERTRRDRVLLQKDSQDSPANQRGLRSDQDLEGVKPVRHGVRQASSGSAAASGGGSKRGASANSGWPTNLATQPLRHRIFCAGRLRPITRIRFG